MQRIHTRHGMAGSFTDPCLRRLLLPGLIVLALVSNACAGAGTGPAGAGGRSEPAPVLDLASIETLRGAFNDDAGSTRLILLVSPT